MRPSEFYALPTLDARPWYDAYGRIETFFDDPRLEYDLDHTAAREAGADDVVFARKLFANVDGERTVTYTAVLFEGRPVGIHVTAGRGEQDQEHRLITDKDAYLSARGYLDRFMRDCTNLTSDLTDPEAEVDVLSGVYGHAVIRHAGEVRLVDVDHLSDVGTVLFDEKAYRSAFDRIVRPAFGNDDREEFRQGISGKRMQDLVVQAVLESMPEGVEATDEFDDIPRVDGITRFQRWSPVLVAGPDATYALGVTSLPGYFTFDLGLEKVGPPELYAELARSASPAP